MKIPIQCTPSWTLLENYVQNEPKQMHLRKKAKKNIATTSTNTPSLASFMAPPQKYKRIVLFSLLLRNVAYAKYVVYVSVWAFDTSRDHRIAVRNVRSLFSSSTPLRKAMLAYNDFDFVQMCVCVCLVCLHDANIMLKIIPLLFAKLFKLLRVLDFS